MHVAALRSICKQQAQPSCSRVLASAELATRDVPAVANESNIDCKHARKSARDVYSLAFG
jgi:hypothetical protein